MIERVSETAACRLQVLILPLRTSESFLAIGVLHDFVRLVDDALPADVWREGALVELVLCIQHLLSLHRFSASLPSDQAITIKRVEKLLALVSRELASRIVSLQLPLHRISP